MNEVAIFDLLEKIHAAVKGKDREKPDQKELSSALAAAQAEFKIARRTKENQDFKEAYEDLGEVMSASRPYLAKNGLSVTFPINSSDETGTILSCILLHSSGQSLESSVRILPIKNDPRSFASEVSFMKRLLYSGLVGVVASGEDDDAEWASDNYKDAEAKRSLLAPKPDAREEKLGLTKEQYEDLEFELEGEVEIAEKILTSFNIRDLASMPRAKYRDAMKTIRLIKDNKNKKR